MYIIRWRTKIKFPSKLALPTIFAHTAFGKLEGTLIMTNFETSAMAAFRKAFPSARVTGCYFHLCQSVLCKVNEIGTKVGYETRDEVRSYVRCPCCWRNRCFWCSCWWTAYRYGTYERAVELFWAYLHVLYVRGHSQRGLCENCGPALFPIDLWNQQIGIKKSRSHDKSSWRMAFWYSSPFSV